MRHFLQQGHSSETFSNSATPSHYYREKGSKTDFPLSTGYIRNWHGLHQASWPSAKVGAYGGEVWLARCRSRGPWAHPVVTSAVPGCITGIDTLWQNSHNMPSCRLRLTSLLTAHLLWVCRWINSLMQLEPHGPVTSQGAGSEWCKWARTAISVSEWESEAEGLKPRTIELWIKMKRLELCRYFQIVG